MQTDNPFIAKIFEFTSIWIRLIPINKKIKGFFVKFSLLFKNCRLGFIFACPRINVTWSAGGFPDLLTRHMLFEGMYQEDVLQTLLNVVREGDIVYDVGGHHGLMTVIAAKAAGITGKVVTFEPNPTARKHIENHLFLNGLTNVTIEDVALSDRKGECPFYVQEGVVSWNSTIEKEFAVPQCACITIDTTTLDDYVSRSKLVPHVIKIDTEGSEFKVLKGATQTIIQHKPILIMEFNPISAHAVGEVLSTYKAFLEKQGYALFVLRQSVFGYYDYAQQELFNEAAHTREGRLVNVVCIQKST